MNENWLGVYLIQNIGYIFIYYPLYMLIMQVYHDSGRRRDFGRMSDSGHISQLWSEDMTPVVYLDSGRTS
jgi:hypothetical protein